MQYAIELTEDSSMKIVVGISDMKVSNDIDSVLATYSLGSCIGVAVYDPYARVGGLLHSLLPDSILDPKRAQENPHMFADTGVVSLFKAAYKLGAKKHRMKVIVVGGAGTLSKYGDFDIGKRNYMSVRKMLWRNGVMIDFEHVGGTTTRTLKLNLRHGVSTLTLNGKQYISIR